MSTTAADVTRFLEANRGASRFRIPSTPLEYADLLQRGISVSVVDTVMAMLGISRERLSTLLRISPSTLDRRLKARQDLAGAEADAIYRLLGVLGVAKRVLVTDDNIRSWFTRPQPGLDGRIPMELLENSAGAEAVTTLLEQIYHSIVP